MKSLFAKIGLLILSWAMLPVFLFWTAIEELAGQLSRLGL